jgi:hypothetical protein
MKTYVIPWMSEEETERFLTEIRRMSKAKTDNTTAAQSETDNPFRSRSETTEPANLSIGGL